MSMSINGHGYTDVGWAVPLYPPAPPGNFAELLTAAPPPVEEASRQMRVFGVETSPHMWQREADRIREQGKAAADGFYSVARCMRIAMWIVQGDNVSPRDDRYLAEHNPELHRRAWMMRVPKDEPVDHDSITDDEERKLFADLPVGTDTNLSPLPEQYCEPDLGAF